MCINGVDLFDSFLIFDTNRLKKKNYDFEQCPYARVYNNAKKITSST